MSAPTQKDIRMMHLVNLMSIAYADGQITQEENDVLVDIAQELDLTEEEFDNCVEYWKNTDENEIPIAIPDEDDTATFMGDFIRVMASDGKIEDEEESYLQNIAEQFGISEDDFRSYLLMSYLSAGSANADNGQDTEEETTEENTESGEVNDFFNFDFDNISFDEPSISLGKMRLKSKELEKAFDCLFPLIVSEDEEDEEEEDPYDWFSIIPGTDTRLFRITPEQLEKVKEAADKEDCVAQYVLGRYHQVVKPDEDSLEKAQKLLEAAAENLSDADWALAMRYLYGYHGPVSFKHYQELIDEAINYNSFTALRQKLHDVIHGEHGFFSPNPKAAIQVINDYLEDEDDNYGEKYPFLYDLLGDAYHKIGNKEKADECYEKAEELGYFEAAAHRFINRVEGPDKDFYRETFDFILSFGCDEDERCPGCFLLRGLENAYHYDKEEKEERRKELSEKIRKDLETAYDLGEGDAAYYLGLYHYEGKYGFEKNNREAWSWFSKGQNRESGLAYAGTARMITEGIKPSNMPSNYLEYLQINALRRGAMEVLPAVIESYKAGKFDPLAQEIEENYLPLVNQEENLATIPAVFTLSPDGKAVIYKMEKAEWNKMPTIIGAKRLAPVCNDALDKLAKDAGFTDRLAIWIDIEAPRKGLPVNVMASKLSQGLISGTVAFTLVDNLYEETPFFGGDEAVNVINALDAELIEVITDLSKIKETKRTESEFDAEDDNALLSLLGAGELKDALGEDFVKELVGGFATSKGTKKKSGGPNQGYIARIEADGKAHILKSTPGMLSVFEASTYDPARLKSLYDLGTKMGLPGRLTLWTDNSALRQNHVMESMHPKNSIGTKWCQGLVADNFFVALEDERFSVTLFDDLEQLKQVSIALGVKKENIILD